jgi:hypothetical protein
LNSAIRDESACLELPKLGGPMATKKSAGAERLCICSTGQCNRAPIAEQVNLDWTKFNILFKKYNINYLFIFII